MLDRDSKVEIFNQSGKLIAEYTIWQLIEQASVLDYDCAHAGYARVSGGAVLFDVEHPASLANEPAKPEGVTF